MLQSDFLKNQVPIVVRNSGTKNKSIRHNLIMWCDQYDAILLHDLQYIFMDKDRPLTPDGYYYNVLAVIFFSFDNIRETKSVPLTVIRYYMY